MTFKDSILLRELLSHVGHDVEVVTYGDDNDNVSIECNDCNLVLVDAEDGDEGEQQ